MLTQDTVEQGTSNMQSFAVDDRFFLGEGLFETMRVISQEVCYGPLHWKRIHTAAKQLDLPFTLSLEEWLALLNKNIHADNIQTGGIKVIMTSGQAPRGLDARGQQASVLVKPFTYTVQDKSISLMTAAWQRDNHNPIYRYKTISYFENILGCRHAKAQGYDDALFFSKEDHALETTVANLFIIVDKRLISPPLTSAILPGIIRSRMPKLCKALGMVYEEKNFLRESILDARSVFITNALHGIRAVACLDDIPIACDHALLSKFKALLWEDMMKFSGS